MRINLISASLTLLVAACLLTAGCSSNKSSGSSSAQAAPSGQGQLTGILIDNACGANMMKQSDPQTAAAGHPRSCAMKDACAASGYAVITGNQLIKFDDHGNDLAKDYLAKSDKTDNLKVTVDGTVSGDTIAVTSINDAQ